MTYSGMIMMELGAEWMRRVCVLIKTTRNIRHWEGWGSCLVRCWEIWYIMVYPMYIMIWIFPKIGVPQNGWFIRENPGPIKMDDLGVPLFLETPIYWYHLESRWRNSHWSWFIIAPYKSRNLLGAEGPHQQNLRNPPKWPEKSRLLS